MGISNALSSAQLTPFDVDGVQVFLRPLSLADSIRMEQAGDDTAAVLLHACVCEADGTPAFESPEAAGRTNAAAAAKLVKEISRLNGFGGDEKN